MDPAASTAPDADHRASRGVRGASRPLLLDVVRCEWTKLWSVRSTHWALLGTAAAMVSLAAVFPATAPSTPSDPTAYGLSSFFQAQLGAAVIGVLAITSEYTTGSIRATLTATPQRITVLSAKTIVVVATTTVVGIASAFLAFLVAARVFAGRGISLALTDPGAVRAVIGAGLYLAVLAVLALALGVLFRSSVGTIAAVVALMLVLPGLATALPGAWQDTVVPYLPAEAGQAIIGRTRFAPGGAHLLAPWTGFAILCAYTAVALIAAAATLTTRDSR
jgi:ABC-type transport system involved in multi-copper enzyme maturation permease subunit